MGKVDAEPEIGFGAPEEMERLRFGIDGHGFQGLPQPNGLRDAADGCPPFCVQRGIVIGGTADPVTHPRLLATASPSH